MKAIARASIGCGCALLATGGVQMIASFRERKKEAINRELVDAVHQMNYTTVISALKAGADPNSHVSEISSASSLSTFRRIWRWVIHKPVTEPTPPSDTCLDTIIGEGIVDKTTVEGDMIAAALITYGADLSDSWHPDNVDVAAYYHSHKTLRALLEHGADANYVGDAGITPIMDADDKDTQLLLQYGANPNIRDIDGRNAFAHACQTEPTEIDRLQLLLRSHCNPSEPDNQGMTPLMITPDPATARFLLQHGTHVEARDNKGRTALDWALRRRTKMLHREHSLVEKQRNAALIKVLESADHEQVSGLK